MFRTVSKLYLKCLQALQFVPQVLRADFFGFNVFGIVRPNPFLIEAAVGRQPNKSEDWINDARRRLAEWRGKKPETKAGQIRALWPEIKVALEQGQSYKSLQTWLEEEAGVSLTTNLLRVYVRRCRAKEIGRPTRKNHTKGRQQVIAPLSTPAVLEQSEMTSDPMAGARKALNKPRFDIRKIHADGDPEGRNLI